MPVTDSSHQSVQDSSVAEAPMELSQVAMLTQRLSSLEAQLQAVAQISLQQQENLASQQPPIGHTQEVASQPNLELLTEDQSLSNVPGVNGAIQPHYGPGEHPLQEYSVLGTTLDVRIKSKIIAGNYIELSSLLTKHEDTLALRMSQDGKEIVLGRKDSKAITSIFEWLRLFNIYAAVLSTAKPALGPHLNTYMVRIMDLHKLYPGTNTYLRYDEEFRRLRAVNEEHHPWSVLHMGTLVRCTAPLASLSAPPTPLRKPFPSSSTGKGVCFDFNSVKGCSRSHCRFEHSCD